MRRDYEGAMEHPVPAPPELGELDGLAYALFLPDDEPRAGVVILHGAGSAKESHFDFARGCRADGIAALAYDARGHGRSAGEFGPGAIDDALAMVELLRGHAGPVALRGSSMGGFQAIHAGARDPSLCAVVAICPAPEDILLRGLRSRAAPRSAATRPPPSAGSRASTSTRRPPRWGPARRCSCCTPAGTSRFRGR